MNLFQKPNVSDARAPLYWNTILMFLCLLALTPLVFLDQRFVGGSLVWIKPIKFALSIGIYSLTLIWILQFFPKSEKLYTRISWTITITGLIEIIAIFGQAARGERSHFNITTPINGLIFTVMGISIGIFWLAHLLLCFRLIQQKSLHPFLKESLIWGLLISAYGMIIGFFMTTPRPEQIELMKNGIMIANGGHTFGAPDGGPGISFFGWSTIAGDLRIAHFFGMHAIQIFSLIVIYFFGFDGKNNVFTLSRVPLRFLGIGILGITLTMNLQALNGESIFHTSMPYITSYSTFILFVTSGLFLLSKQTNRNLTQSGK